MSTEKAFNKIARKQAKFIRDGGLTEPEGYSQISRKAWPGLEAINASGFLTMDSQAGSHNLERAYITGFMQVDKAESFAEYLNIWSDKVAFCSMPIENEFYSISVTRDYRKEVGRWVGFTSLPLYESSYAWKIYYEKLGLPSNAKLVLVTAFDPKWGRPCWSKNGLFKAVLEALHPKAHTLEELV